ncbi:MAP3K12-binding inhibitory protein 1-like isoform X2 [Corticium candelabrum]|uniref:MAP3K12-binding inhibitory protein 1-like isoform X2 n=1 Tax=Corticium candelabrum TaxID=121492 RepID=UPI002E26791F|nr:MAP3K12-binding inhibitory protein 1-like isoform X2 [Corticium candelabrum]XP_062503673.1 MAP3K12-binding inhibitory protein 1-like isoform X2 [Corticium candelabrum]
MLSVSMDANVQITADRKEIDRRISAFILQKRQENEVRSFKHYFPFQQPPGEPTCARTQCQCIRRIVCRRQANDSDQRDTSTKETETNAESTGGEWPNGIEERLRNLEHHVALKPGQAVPSDVYSRIQRLEEKVLYLEGLSPEYFQPDLPGRITTQNLSSLSQSSQNALLLSHHPVQYGAHCQQVQQDQTSVVNDDKDLSLEELDERILKAPTQ